VDSLAQEGHAFGANPFDIKTNANWLRPPPLPPEIFDEPVNYPKFLASDSPVCEHYRMSSRSLASEEE
jgi:hypothetical protein